ncbi:MAG TPA: hypothetical protein VFG69_09480 [Nannocystaceae bacterium]|nr:hypothetical protein [Nannocystaceae bacterium]
MSRFTLLLVAVALAVSCRGRGTTNPDAMTRSFVRTVLTEDRAVMQVCNAVALVPTEDGAQLGEAALDELRAELVVDSATVFTAIGLDARSLAQSVPPCELDDLAERSLADAGLRPEPDAAQSTAAACTERLASESAAVTVVARALAKSDAAAPVTAAQLRADVQAALGEDIAPALAKREGEACKEPGSGACAGAIAERVAKDVPARHGSTDGGVSPAIRARIGRAAKLVGVLGIDEGGHAAPRAITASLDFSFVVLVKMMELGEITDRAIDDASGSLAWFAPPVRVLLETVAAEVLAIANERIFRELESRELLNRASVAREACRIVQAGDSRPAVAARSLKRAILRLAKQPPPDLVTMCRDFPDKAAQRRCARWAQELTGRVGEKQAAASMKAELPPTNWGAVHPELAQWLPKAKGGAETPGKVNTLALSETMLATAEACDALGQPDAGCLRQLGSIAAFYFVDGDAKVVSGDLAGRLAASEPMLAGMRAKLDLIDRRLAGVDAAVGRIETDVVADGRRLEAQRDSIGDVRGELSDLRGAVGVLLRRKQGCATEIGNVRSNRLRYLDAVFPGWTVVQDGVPPGRPGSSRELCEKPAVGARIVGTRQGTALHFDASVIDVCDALAAFELGSVNTDNLFGRCSATPQAAGKPDDLATAVGGAIKAAREVSPTAELHVTITGHTDEVPIKGRCANGATHNTELSELRAKAFADVLATRVAGITGLTIETEGVGDDELVARCGARGPEGCHARNRRIGVGVRSKRAFLLNPDNCE